MIFNFNTFKKLNKTGNELDTIREKNFDFFEKKGFPSKKDESWKYTDFKNIFDNAFNKVEILGKKSSNYNSEWLIKDFDHNQIILLNGHFIKSNFIFEDINKIDINPLSKFLKNKKDFEKIKNFFSGKKNSLESLNHALANDGIILEVKNGYFFKKPLIIYNFFDQDSENKIITNKFFISLGESACLNILEYYKSENNTKYFNNVTHNYSIKKNSIFKRFIVNNNLDNSYNYHLTNIKSYSSSIFENFLFSSGSNFIKNEIHCDLLESFASCFINGAIFLDGKQHHELKTNVNHKYANCKSSQLIKSVLLNNSKGTYQGKIYVDKNAQKTNGYQLSKALVLSPNSEFNSKPELEIYADDVKCSHGSTTGNLDEDSIFYLMTRGISKNEAMRMLVTGFLKEAIETITDESIKAIILKLFMKRISKIKI